MLPSLWVNAHAQEEGSTVLCAKILPMGDRMFHPDVGQALPSSGSLLLLPPPPAPPTLIISLVVQWSYLWGL
jgi:hypothetical protein